MRSLFWRIFAAVWLANIAIIFALSLMTTVSFETETIPGLEITRLQAAMDEQLRRLDRHARRNGSARLEQSLRIAASMSPVAFYALDANDVDRLGKPVSQAVIEAAAATRAGAIVHAERMRTLPSVLHDDDSALVLVAAVEGPLLARVLFKRPFGGWTHIIVALVVSALVSALLAWYVAAPLARIRLSTRRFAEGELDARVGRLRFGSSTEIASLASEFDHMAERIRSLVENNRRLIRDVSHELRSPLARLRVAVELARGQDLAAVEQSLDRIERESIRLEGMLAQAIELSRLETRPERPSETFALDVLLAEITDNAAYEAAPLGCEVVLVASTRADVTGSRDALHSAIENIVRNAIAYTVEGSTIEVHLEREGPGHACVRIRDHGPGVAEADLARIFEPFFRTDSARARSSGGTGLGLAIAHRAIANHDGSVIARNAGGGGLEVVIRLPLAGPT